MRKKELRERFRKTSQEAHKLRVLLREYERQVKLARIVIFELSLALDSMKEFTSLPLDMEEDIAAIEALRDTWREINAKQPS